MRSRGTARPVNMRRMALSDAAGGGDRSAMAVYVWKQDMAPDFPLAVLEHTVAGDEDPMHWHDHFEVALVREGRGVFKFGRRALEAAAGDVFFIDNSQPHVALADRGTPLRLLLVLFRPELIAPVGCRDLDLGYLAPFRFDEGASPRVRGDSVLAGEIGQVLGRMADGPPRQLLDANLRTVLALAAQAPGVAATPEATRAASDRRERVRPVLAYVDRHCREGITLGEVAEVAHVSPSRVRHLFKDVTGVSFKEYVTQVRMTEAKRLLLGTELSVADVAGTVSYTNLSQFYKVFARSCGMSPGEYRRYYTPAGA